jgi:hypothetical protein
LLQLAGDAQFSAAIAVILLHFDTSSSFLQQLHQLHQHISSKSTPSTMSTGIPSATSIVESAVIQGIAECLY